MALRYILCFTLHFSFSVESLIEEISISSYPTFTIVLTTLEPVRFFLLHPCIPRAIYKYMYGEQKFTL